MRTKLPNLYTVQSAASGDYGDDYGDTRRKSFKKICDVITSNCELNLKLSIILPLFLTSTSSKIQREYVMCKSDIGIHTNVIMTIFICIFISKQQALDTGYTQNTYEQSQDQVLPIIHNRKW